MFRSDRHLGFAVRKSKKTVKDVAAIAQSKASAEDKLKQLELKCLQHVSQIAPVQPLPGCTCMGAHATQTRPSVERLACYAN